MTSCLDFTCGNARRSARWTADQCRKCWAAANNADVARSLNRPAPLPPADAAAWAGGGCCGGGPDLFLDPPPVAAASPVGPAPPRLVEVPPAGVLATPAFNASLLRYGGRLLLAYRHREVGASIHLAELADDYTPLRSAPLRLAHPRATAQEDPRLTLFRGRPRVWFYGFDRRAGTTTMMYADLNDDLTAGPVHAPELHARQWPKEKNWQPFEYQEEQYVVYTIAPHVVVRIDGDRAERVCVSDTPFPWSGGASAAGGAPPVLVGDRYYHWFHGCANPAGGPVTEARHAHYNVGLYTFEARPPFRVVAMSPRPLLWGDRHANLTVDRCPYHAVAFPCGAILEGGVWKVSMGWNDRRVMVAEWPAAVADAALAGSPK